MLQRPSKLGLVPVTTLKSGSTARGPDFNGFAEWPMVAAVQQNHFFGPRRRPGGFFFLGMAQPEKVAILAHFGSFSHFLRNFMKNGEFPPPSPVPPGTLRGRIRVRYIRIRPRRVPGGTGEGGGGGGTHLSHHWPSWAGTGKITVFHEIPQKVRK